ncbi:protein phosphatase 2C domain-containing protein [Bacillus niameyensis]|uniref:protein phosphatase 2C domain-containing protein n=1 Tax=Bacillus niameyensis TaxID=1522308 RepID=UPI00078321FB|nr:protein phosphatase 2C domain-containing protein [Bacillus niameyensis]
MRIEKLSIQGSNPLNEDALVMNEKVQLYGVIDGATSLKPFTGPNGETGGYLAANLIKNYIEDQANSSIRSTPLTEIVLQANALLKDSMIKNGVDVEQKEDLWTAGLALIRIGEHHIEFVQIGDCMILAKYKDGDIRLITRDQVHHIDQKTMELWKVGIERGMRSQKELRQFVTPLILQNKQMMNTLDGYSVVSGEPEVKDYIEAGKINRILLEELLIISDGLFFPKALTSDTSRGDSWKLLINNIQEKGLKGYADWLINLEDSDPECQQYPRFKKSDDKTGIRILFN